jgi:hypothetical protein
MLVVELLGFGLGFLFSWLWFRRVFYSARSEILDLQERLSASEKLLANKISDVHFERDGFLRMKDLRQDGASQQIGLQPALTVFSEQNSQKGNGQQGVRLTKVLSAALKDSDQTNDREIEGQSTEQFREDLNGEADEKNRRSYPVIQDAPVYIQTQDGVYRVEVVSASGTQTEEEEAESGPHS